MPLRSRLFLVLVVALAVSPNVAAWSTKGFREPDTRADKLDGFMFTTATPAQTATGSPVYFNGFLAQGRGPYAECVLTPTFPANIAVLCDAQGCPVVAYSFGIDCVTSSIGLGSGLLGLQTLPVPAQPIAILGVWKDCNRDGFIGWGDQGLWEYKSELLSLPGAPGTTLCPPVAEPRPVIPPDWKPSHNDGKWVRELLPIGWNQWGRVYPDGKQVDDQVYDLNDTDARVWADWGKPGIAPRDICWGYPAPRDTFRRTGGLVEWADCFASFQATDAMGEVANATGVQAIAFNDAPRDQSASGSPLNQRNPWGGNEDAAYVEMCNDDDAGITVIPADPVFGWHHGVKAPWVPSGPDDVDEGVHTNGSLAGQVKEAYYWNTWMTCHQGQAPFQAQLSEQPYMVESGSENLVGVRTRSDYAFHYYGGMKPGPFLLAAKGWPTDQGTRVTNPEGFWTSDGGAQIHRAPLVSRSGIEFTPVQYLTYYAQIGATAIAAYGLTLPVSTGAYGSQACPSIGLGAPPAGGWACDPAAWATFGTAWTSTGEYGVRVGQPYRLRDVDCFDESFDAARQQGLTLGQLTTGARCEFG